MNFKEILNLGMGEYLIYKKEAWLYSLKQTEEGRKFLKTLWKLQQTEADTSAIKAFREGRG